MNIATLPRRAPALPQWRVPSLFASAECFLEREREQLAMWWVVGLGSGIAAWLVLASPNAWAAALCLAVGAAGLSAALGKGRVSRAVAGFALAAALGLVLIWLRSEWVAAPRLERPVIAEFSGRVASTQQLAARGSVRLTLAPEDPALPALVRVNIDGDHAPEGLGEGARVQLKARLMPPMPMPLPGAHDYARDAWFAGFGATGRALGEVAVLEPAGEGGLQSVRERLDRHIRTQLPGAEGAIATALATGDQGALPEEDAEAMRRSGLAHLLSVSGLHIAAAVGAAFLLTLRLLALSERLALRFNLVLVAAGSGALAGVGYTLLTGMQVPTVRSCIAALLVLVGIALGREAISLRLIATGALLVLLIRPEALAGASFQLSFAAVTAIVTLYSLPWFKRYFEKRDDGWALGLGRSLGVMVLTGLVVEIALLPFALYHFHRAGLYGVVANLAAIPLTTFVIMPLEAGALLLDACGLGRPLWAVCGWTLGWLLSLAHGVAGAEGAVALLPAMPRWAFGAMVAGGLWLCLWSSRARLWGLVPLLVGALAAAAAPRPDLLVTGDGRHLAIVGEDGTPFLLRGRAGDFVRDMFGENSGFDGEALELERGQGVQCSRDACLAEFEQGGRAWRVLAIRSKERLEWEELTRACRSADIVVAEPRLPRACQPRWLKLDRAALERTGGLTIALGHEPTVATVAERVGQHGWGLQQPTSKKRVYVVDQTASSLPPGSMK
jgi:competence protein ComEC